MIIIENCTTPQQTRDGICEFLSREATRYRRDAERERNPNRKAKDVARCGALDLAAELLRDALLRP